jgi:hypothetical protein
MCVTCANTIALLLLRNLIAICSKCKGKRDSFCLAIFESKCMHFVRGIDVAVVSYQCFNVIHHQIETTTSCTVSGVCQNHVFQVF